MCVFISLVYVKVWYFCIHAIFSIIQVCFNVRLDIADACALIFVNCSNVAQVMNLSVPAVA